MITWLKENAGKHLEALVIASALVLGGHFYLTEHDARVKADATVKAAQTTIDTLQKTQTAVQQTAAREVIVLQKEAATVKTAPQAEAALKADTAVTAALPSMEVVPDAPGKVEVDAVELFKGVNKCEIDAVNVGACTKELDIEKQITTQKDTEIVALKKKPSFWHRAKDTAITLGIGAAIGYAAHR